MPLITFIPDGTSIEIGPGISIRDAAIRAGIDIPSPCGGYGICGKCAVRIESGDVRGEIDENGFCLSCKAFPLTDCTIEIPAKLQLESIDISRTAHQPDIEIDPLPFAVGLPDGISRENALGLAVDVGTTSIVSALVRLTDGEVLGSATSPNPQKQYGDDVISRIAHASEQDGLDELRNAVSDCINEQIRNLCNDASVDPRNIADIVASGNATMTHLLLGVSPVDLGQAPYQPVFKSHEPVEAKDLGIANAPSATLRVLPNIAGFVGGDTVAGILATGMNRSDSTRLFVDIGTNGEIVLGSAESLAATSAAAGPAFEGGRMERGMSAGEGAIDHVRIEDDVILSVIGDVEPRGICGSGLIEAVASMLSVGLLHSCGHLLSHDEAEMLHEEKLRLRFLGLSGRRRFVLWQGEKDSVYISQKDIAEFQLAKAAIRAAINLMLEKREVGLDDIDEIIIAGAFGYHLDIDDVLKIGLLPMVDKGKVRAAGNASLEGAMMALLSNAMTKEAERVASNVEFIELANDPEFRDEFVEAIPF
jgi:uncharacterized 2Fe-2S/4Fe-4S cluster protein (DUF4445 family)